MVIAPHPDDESLGVGGALLRHRSQGDSCAWVLITSMSEDLGFSKEQIEARREVIKKVADSYKFENIYELNFKTTQLDRYPISEIIQKLSAVIDDYRPEVLYVPFCADVHSDHQIAFQASWACSKSFRVPYVKTVMMYETVSETDFAPPQAGPQFQPNVFIDITDHFEEKSKILCNYEGELGDHPFPRSLQNIRSLAEYRGATAGVGYAEAFVLLRDIVK